MSRVDFSPPPDFSPALYFAGLKSGGGLKPTILIAGICLAVMSNSSIVHWLFSFVCHQQPDRTVGTMAVCARCAGIFAGTLLGLLSLFPWRRRLFLMALTMVAVDWASEVAGLRPAWAPLRIVTGSMLGLACAPAIKECLNPENATTA